MKRSGLTINILWAGCLAAAVMTGPAQAETNVSAIFGSAPWTFTDKLGKPGRFLVGNAEGVPVLAVEGASLFARSTVSFNTGSEVTALVRFEGDASAGSLKISSNPEGSTNTHNEISLSLVAGSAPDVVRVILKGAEPRDYLTQRTYKARWISGCRLGIPEDIRVRVEHQIASLPTLDRKWLKVRWQLREEGTRLYVDDRVLWESPSNTAGRFSLEMTKGVELALFQGVPLKPAPAGFEPIALDGYVNAAQLDGSKVNPDVLPSAGVTLGGVPFMPARTNGLGNDHMDLEPSWLQNGLQGGRDSPRDGVFGGRWEGAWSLNPARIQFAIPAGRYSAIHLLAASDSAPDSVPVVTAQFYIPGAGRPVQVRRGNVQRFVEPPGAAVHLPATLANGKAGNLFLITIPIDPGTLACFGDMLELELTKEVRLYRAFPDPSFYSFHQAGLPSSVHVYALTLERPAVKLDLRAANGLNVWTAPEKPVYTATLSAAGPVKRVTLTVNTVSDNGQEKTSQKREVEFRPGEAATVRLELDLKTYGYHACTLTVSEGERVIQTEKRGLAYLHPDTRERGGWDRGKGPLFGFWNWKGGHDTPAEPIPLTMMALAGAETDHGSFDEKSSPAAKEVARKYRIQCYKAFRPGDHYTTAAFANDLQQFGLDVAKSNFVAKLDRFYLKPDDLNRPLFLSFFPEPGIGMHTFGVPLSYDGLSETNDYVFTADEEKRYQYFLNGFVEGAKIVKERYPEVQCLMPHGDPGFPLPFLRRSPEVRRLLDGLTVDVPVFERLPEGQMHKVALHRMYLCREEFRKAGLPNPWLPMYEGPCLPSRPGSLTPAEHAALSVRNSLILLAYGVVFQTGGWAAFDAGSYWGEQHYGGGICDPLPLATPKPSYAAYATMTRQLNRRNFDKWVPTGSLSTYAMQFRHYKDNSLVHVFWTIRGRRPVSVAVPAGARVVVADSMDNAVEAVVKDGLASFSVGQAPCFVIGLPEAPAITLGVADHSDVAPAADAVPLASLVDGSWSVSTERDAGYEESSSVFIRRYPGRMTVRPVEGMGGPAAGPVLAVHLEKPERDCSLMPFYTTLVPKKPLVIPGKGSHLGLWVNASSDWGRVIYGLRDAKGERWLSIGPKGAWNNDDIHSRSSFNFDGWRYLRFELPACSPFDLFREAGSTWWGSYSAGDGVPDIPLTLEKIMVERRTHAMYVNDPQPASTNDVLLGGLFVEYETPEDKTDRVVELSRLRMPVPTGVPDLDNPIRRMEANGVGAAVAITEIVVPLHESDGTRCTVQFTTASNAAGYEVWASPYPDGRGAVKVAEKIKAPGALARGFTPDTDFYLFVTYTDTGKKASKPSKPFRINLKDTFSQK